MCLSGEALPDTLRGVFDAVDAPARVERAGVGWGAVAQLGERLVRNEEVSGSIPLSSTKRINDLQEIFLFYGLVVGSLKILYWTQMT